MKESEINREIMEMVDPILNPLGFVKNKGVDGWIYNKQTNFGYNEVLILVWSYGPLHFVDLAFTIRIDALNRIYNSFASVSLAATNTNSTIATSFNTPLSQEDGKIKVETPEDLGKASEALKDVLEKSGMDFFNRFKSIRDIDLELNRDSRPKNLYCSEIRHRPFIGITAAALNNNHNFSYWENFYREKLKNDIPQAKEKYEALVSHLKDNVLKKH